MPHKYPWISFINIRRVIDGQDRWFFCGATIITDRWLVTAAHCIEGAAEIEVRSGCHLSNQCEMVQTACRWIIHPDYYAPVFRNDIALIQLGRPLRFGFKIQPACLPGPSLPNFEHVIVAGWGATSNNGPGSLALKEGVMRVGDKWDGMWYYRFFNNKIMISATRVNANICFGDSGTAMGRFLNGRFQLDGVISFLSDLGCDQAPNGFARVEPFVPWILANV